MANFKLVIEYDGTDFLGWQGQAEGRTVQDEIERVLERVLGESLTLIGAGRTDAGVHARGQVANFRTASQTGSERIHSALNGVLPRDIRVLSMEDVPDSFHARHDARERAYRYFITMHQVAIGRQYWWYVPYQLDKTLLDRGSSLLSGHHDFEAFSKVGSDSNHFRCHVNTSRWTEEKDTLVYEIRADRFVRGMVRAIVGNLVDLARGHISLDEFGTILEGRDRGSAGMAAPACGLVLEEVVY